MWAFLDWLDGHGHGHGHGHAHRLAPPTPRWPAELEGDARAGGLELQITLLASALTSGRHAVTANPYPPMYEGMCTFVDKFAAERRDPDGRDYDALRNALAALPPAALAAQSADHPPGSSPRDRRVAELVEWLGKVCEVRAVPVAELYRRKGSVGADDGDGDAGRSPTHQFAVNASSQHSGAGGTQQQRWAEQVNRHGTALAYRGAALEDFHSILSSSSSSSSSSRTGGSSHAGEPGSGGSATDGSGGGSSRLWSCPERARTDAPMQCGAARRWPAARYAESIACVAVYEVLRLAEGSADGRRQQQDEDVALADPEQHGRLVGLLLYTSSTPTAADPVQQPLETDNSSPGSSGGGGGSGQPLDAEAASARGSARFLLYLALVFAVAMRDSDWAASLTGWHSYSSPVAE
jgi:hypothetical protein